jgi:phage baseplate assembly protein W
MSYNPIKIDPLDLQPRKAIGVSFPFNGNAVFNSTYYSKDALKANIINYLLTGKGERFLNPNFGTGLRNLLFEQIVDKDVKELQYIIRQDLQTNFPTAIISTLEIQSNPDEHSIELFIGYFIENTNISDELYISFAQ